MKKKIYSVSELNSEIKYKLDNEYSFLWIAGEVSNLRQSSTGHTYFTLKDEFSKINSMIFAGQQRQVKCSLKDGLSIVGLGRLSVWEPRGTYQIIFEYIDKTAQGDLMGAFEALKEKLSKEGLFDGARKKTLPFLPCRMGVITSPSGAVVKDIIHIASRRFPGMAIDVVPVHVQGKSAETEIIAALRFLNRIHLSNVIIIARGGGSFEDLEPFNSEGVARAIAESRIPVISAVGHETDFTIADFVADVRASTPSAAVEMVVPVKSELKTSVQHLTGRLIVAVKRDVSRRRGDIQTLSGKLTSPIQRVKSMRVYIDSLAKRMEKEVRRKLLHRTAHLNWWRERFDRSSPQKVIKYSKDRAEMTAFRLQESMTRIVAKKREPLHLLTEKLNAFDPKKILKKGYCIAFRIDSKEIVSDTDQIRRGDKLELLLYKGRLAVTVDERSESLNDYKR